MFKVRDLDWRDMDVVEVSLLFDQADITALAGVFLVQRHLQILAEKAR